ncbi:MAG: hypothetical protein HQL29_02425 [Candidatus Omnitrophica bacterium]|nr:hypothetical protein [Candidatus Omnitrophota bacterium]
MREMFLKYTKEIHEKLLDKKIRKMVSFKKDWTKDMPQEPGVYLVFQKN